MKDYELALLSVVKGLPGYSSAMVALARERGIDPENRERDRALYTVTFAQRFSEETPGDELRDAIAAVYGGHHFEYARRRWCLLNTNAQGNELRRELRGTSRGGGYSMIDIVERATPPAVSADDFVVGKLEMVVVLRTLFERGQLRVAQEVEEAVHLLDAIRNLTARATKPGKALSADEDAAQSVEEPLGDALLAACWFSETKRRLPQQGGGVSGGGADIAEPYNPLARENL